jgi:hypothetical protein
MPCQTGLRWQARIAPSQLEWHSNDLSCHLWCSGIGAGAPKNRTGFSGCGLDPDAQRVFEKTLHRLKQGINFVKFIFLQKKYILQKRKEVPLL